MSETEKTLWTVPEENLPRLKAEIEKLARKAEQLGFEPPTLEILESRFAERIVNEVTGAKVTYKVYDVRVTGKAPKLAGWKLIAVVDHFTSGVRGTNIIRRLPNTETVELPEEYRTVEQRCDHCESTRYRRDTFALVSETGEWKLIGRDCLKDFTGHKNPQALAKWAEYLKSALDDAENSDQDRGYHSQYHLTMTVLGSTAALIRNYGWVSRKTAQEHQKYATADMLLNVMNNPQAPDEYKEAAKPIAEDIELAKAVKTWIVEELSVQESLNDYQWNLVASLSEEYVHYKNIGLAASGIMAYKREKGELPEKNGKPRPISQHQGEVGQKIEVTLTVTRRLDFSNDYSRHGGTYSITIMEDESGNVYVWKTASEHLDEGETYQLRGTIKEHTNFKAQKQTVLTRCKIMEAA